MRQINLLDDTGSLKLLQATNNFLPFGNSHPRSLCNSLSRLDRMPAGLSARIGPPHSPLLHAPAMGLWTLERIGPLIAYCAIGYHGGGLAGGGPAGGGGIGRGGIGAGGPPGGNMKGICG